MAFQVPASKASIGQDQFTFGPETGSEYSVKKAKFVPLGTLEALDDTSAAIEFFGEKGTAQGDFIRSLDPDQFGALVDAWRDDSALTAGESQASGS